MENLRTPRSECKQAAVIDIATYSIVRRLNANRTGKLVKSLHAFSCDGVLRPTKERNKNCGGKLTNNLLMRALIVTEGDGDQHYAGAAEGEVIPKNLPRATRNASPVKS